MSPEALDTSVIDSPVVDDTPIDSEIDETPAEGADESIETDVEPAVTEETEGEAAPAFTGTLIKDGKLDPAVKKFLDPLKATAPAAEKQLRNAAYIADALKRDFPGGVAEVKARIGELQQTIDDLGGPDGVKSTKEELAFFHDIDQQFTAGDPRFIESLIAAPEGQAAFLKLAPSMIDKYAAMHPEGFDALVNSKFMGVMASADLKSDLVQLGWFVNRLPDGPEKQEIQQRWDSLARFYNGVSASAAKKPETPKFAESPKPVDDTREKQLTQREAQIKETEFKSAWNGELKSAFDSQWKEQTKGRNLDDVKDGYARGLFQSLLNRAIDASKDDKAKIAKFYAAGDAAGYQKTIRQFFAREIPKAMKLALDKADPPKNGQRRAAAAAPPPAANGRPAAAPAQQGYQPITKMPKMEDIDFSKTTMEMYRDQGRAVLKNGRKVSFTR